MAEKTHDICVKVGQYDKDGETKNRYENVGVVMKGENGSYLLLKRTFNPAGVPDSDSRPSVICSLFPVKDENAEKQEEAQDKEAI